MYNVKEMKVTVDKIIYQMHKGERHMTMQPYNMHYFSLYVKLLHQGSIIAWTPHQHHEHIVTK